MGGGGGAEFSIITGRHDVAKQKEHYFEVHGDFESAWSAAADSLKQVGVGLKYADPGLGSMLGCTYSSAFRVDVDQLGLRDADCT
jgi:hypothetical protein